MYVGFDVLATDAWVRAAEIRCSAKMAEWPNDVPPSSSFGRTEAVYCRIPGTDSDLAAAM